MKAIIVTTATRGVFFGYVPEGVDLGGDTIALEQARCAEIGRAHV